MKNLIVIFFTFFIATGAFAQYDRYKASGDRAFKDADYYKAAYYYKMAADKTRQPEDIPFYADGKATKSEIKAQYPYICYRLAESYRLYQNYHDAAEWYHKILSGNYEKTYPLAGLWYGVCLRADSSFDAALTALHQFKTTYKGEKEYAEIADREIANCIFAKAQYASHRPVIITKMPESWNSGAGDYALVKNGANYWFTSSRSVENGNTHKNDIYYAAAQDSFNPVKINFNGDGAKYKYQYSTPSIAPSGKRIYLTCWYKAGPKTILAIDYSDLENNKWSAPRKLNTNVNAEGFNTMQPFVTADGKRLFFVSDRPGGEGGYDVWVSDLDDSGNPVNAVNLGKTINTPFDEEAPFFDSSHQRLVYSSKGFTGLGGFDFFESYERNGQWSAPVNLGYPVNSSKDDLYYFTDGAQKSYISSDRASDCCLSLFELNYKTVAISGEITSCDSGHAVQGVTVSLIDSASKETIKQTGTGPDGKYFFAANAGTCYMLKIEKPGYFVKVVSPYVVRLNDTSYSADICIRQFAINKPVSLKNILYDFDKASLRPESKVVLDSLVTIMQDNPKLMVELAAYTDSVGSDAYNLKLSQQRAQSCVDYIVSKGINTDRIYARGYGKSDPIAPNSLPNGQDNPAGRQLNRRTAFTIVNK